ncbi:12105_t:CDS:1 [Ambispora leptoticha]|uniref:12105_t:CDS:1 n=1 Tax=Ambispora leptoticha TaxID=144679 RepID=A0A9N9GB87_9GLOM|nr:12105_t:CDS:1 [Ambispora leptoticha]
MSNQKSNKTLIYETLKTLSRPGKVTPLNESRSTDFFAQDYEDDREIYAPETFMKFFGDFFSGEDLEETIQRLQKETDSSSSSSSSGSDDEEQVEKIEVKRKILNVFKKMVKRS